MAEKIYLSQRTDRHIVKRLDSSYVYENHFGTFETAQSDNTGFDFPCSIAADGSDNIYVCDSINKRIVKLTSSLAYITDLDVFVEIGIPYAICFESISGDLYVAGIKNIIYKTREFRVSIARIPTSLTSVTKYNDNVYDTHIEIGKPKGISADFNAGFFIISGTDNLLKVEETGGSFNAATILPITGGENSKFNGNIKHSNGDLYFNKKIGDGSYIFRAKSGYIGIGNSNKISKLSSYIFEGYNGNIFVYDEANFVVKKYDQNMNFIENVFEDTGSTVETDGERICGILELDI